MVDCVISSREIYEDYVDDFPCFIAIFDVLGEVQHLGSAIFAGRKPACSGIRTDDNGRRSVSDARTICRGDTKGKLV